MSYKVVNILDLIDSVGESEVQDMISSFKCELNPSIELFLKNDAINFAKRKISITHLFLNEDGVILAFFTLTHKPTTISSANLSKSSIKTLSRYSKLDEETHSFNISAFLIAQFGKNTSLKNDEEVSGNNMMNFCFDVLEYVQRQVGGGVVYLECEDKEKLLNFYQNDHNLFRVYGKRYSDSEKANYLQLIKFF